MAFVNSSATTLGREDLVLKSGLPSTFSYTHPGTSVTPGALIPTPVGKISGTNKHPQKDGRQRIVYARVLEVYPSAFIGNLSVGRVGVLMRMEDSEMRLANVSSRRTHVRMLGLEAINQFMSPLYLKDTLNQATLEGDVDWDTIKNDVPFLKRMMVEGVVATTEQNERSHMYQNNADALNIALSGVTMLANDLDKYPDRPPPTFIASKRTHDNMIRDGVNLPSPELFFDGNTRMEHVHRFGSCCMGDDVYVGITARTIMIPTLAQKKEVEDFLRTINTALKSPAFSDDDGAKPLPFLAHLAKLTLTLGNIQAIQEREGEQITVFQTFMFCTSDVMFMESRQAAQSKRAFWAYDTAKNNTMPVLKEFNYDLCEDMAFHQRCFDLHCCCGAFKVGKVTDAAAVKTSYDTKGSAVEINVSKTCHKFYTQTQLKQQFAESKYAFRYYEVDDVQRMMQDAMEFVRPLGVGSSDGGGAAPSPEPSPRFPDTSPRSPGPSSAPPSAPPSARPQDGSAGSETARTLLSASSQKDAVYRPPSQSGTISSAASAEPKRFKRGSTLDTLTLGKKPTGSSSSSRKLRAFRRPDAPKQAPATESSEDEM